MIENPKSIEGLIQRLVQELVVHREHLKFNVTRLTASTTITIQAHAGDTPRLIGERAITYKSLKTVAMALGAKQKHRVTLPWILDPEFGQKDQYKFRLRKDWPRERIVTLIRDTAEGIFLDTSAVDVRFFDGEPAAVEVWVSETEPSDLVDVVGKALAVLFNAIAKANGCLLYLDVVAKNTGDREQPVKADGRFARESAN